MRLSSDAFEHGGTLPLKYTCDGDNVSPPLRFYGVPAETKSLALIMEDPDAPAGLWIHWVVWNIDPNTKDISENTVPLGAIVGKGTGQNSHGMYEGPCPPDHEHRYFFIAYALDAPLKLPHNAVADELRAAMNSHVIAEAKLMGLYARQ